MNEPTDPTPQPDQSGGLLGAAVREASQWRPIVKDLIVLITAIWLAVQSWLHSRQLQTVEQKQDTVQTEAQKANANATKAAVVSAEAKELNAVIAVDRGIPGAEKKLEEAKADVAETKQVAEQAQAATQAAK